MTLSPLLTRLLAALPPADQLSFAALAEAIYQVRFTGPTTIHWLNGRPRQIDLGAPVKLSIVESNGEALDTEGKARAG